MYLLKAVVLFLILGKCRPNDFLTSEFAKSDAFLLPPPQDQLAYKNWDAASNEQYDDTIVSRSRTKPPPPEGDNIHDLYATLNNLNKWDEFRQVSSILRQKYADSPKDEDHKQLLKNDLNEWVKQIKLQKMIEDEDLQRKTKPKPVVMPSAGFSPYWSPTEIQKSNQAIKEYSDYGNQLPTTQKPRFDLQQQRMISGAQMMDMAIQKMENAAKAKALRNVTYPSGDKGHTYRRTRHRKIGRSHNILPVRSQRRHLPATGRKWTPLKAKSPLGPSPGMGSYWSMKSHNIGDEVPPSPQELESGILGPTSPSPDGASPRPRWSPPGSVRPPWAKPADSNGSPGRSEPYSPQGQEPPGEGPYGPYGEGLPPDLQGPPGRQRSEPYSPPGQELPGEGPYGPYGEGLPPDLQGPPGRQRSEPYSPPGQELPGEGPYGPYGVPGEGLPPDLQGPTGSYGSLGGQGSPGSYGTPGEQGPPGSYEPPGGQGPSSSYGPPGEQGPPGPYGPPGGQGPPDSYGPPAGQGPPAELNGPPRKDPPDLSGTPFSYGPPGSPGAQGPHSELYGHPGKDQPNLHGPPGSYGPPSAQGPPPELYRPPGNNPPPGLQRPYGSSELAMAPGAQEALESRYGPYGLPPGVQRSPGASHAFPQYDEYGPARPHRSSYHPRESQYGPNGFSGPGRPDLPPGRYRPNSHYGSTGQFEQAGPHYPDYGPPGPGREHGSFAPGSSQDGSHFGLQSDNGPSGQQNRQQPPPPPPSKFRYIGSAGPPPPKWNWDVSQKQPIDQRFKSSGNILRELKRPDAFSDLPKLDDFGVPIQWVALTSANTEDGLARVTDRKTGRNRQARINGTVYVPVIYHSTTTTQKPTTTTQLTTTADPVMESLLEFVTPRNLKPEDWLAFDVTLNMKKAPAVCKGDGCQGRCHKDQCDSGCAGDTCSTGCIGKSCKAMCDGPGCLAMCIGDNCRTQCQGHSCDTRCIGKGCVANCNSLSCRYTTNGDVKTSMVSSQYGQPNRKPIARTSAESDELELESSERAG